MSIKTTDYSSDVIADITDSIDIGVTETAINLTAQAKLLAPVDYAELEGSIMWKSILGDGGFGEGKTGGSKITAGGQLPTSIKKGKAVVGTAVEHGLYQEFGTAKMAAQPYLRPAADIIQNGSSTSKAVKEAMYETVIERKKRGL